MAFFCSSKTYGRCFFGLFFLTIVGHRCGLNDLVAQDGHVGRGGDGPWLRGWRAGSANRGDLVDDRIGKVALIAGLVIHIVAAYARLDRGCGVQYLNKIVQTQRGNMAAATAQFDEGGFGTNDVGVLPRRGHTHDFKQTIGGGDLDDDPVDPSSESGHSGQW